MSLSGGVFTNRQNLQVAKHVAEDLCLPGGHSEKMLDQNMLNLHRSN